VTTTEQPDTAQSIPLDVLIVGRANVDITVRIPQRPTPGRTTFASSPAIITAGGKSLNQAIAAARSGAHVGLIGNAGADEWGRFLAQALEQAGVDTSCFQLIPSAQTGAAVVEVTPDGENYIVLALSPATELTSIHVRTGIDRLHAPVVVTQLDLQPEAVDAALRHHQSDTLIGNLVPHIGIGSAAIAGLDVFVGNEYEATTILGQHHADPMIAAQELRGLGTRTAVVTAGARGAAYSCADGTELISAQQVRAIDTSGAGDAFLGTLAVQLAQKTSLREAVQAAVIAGTTAVQRVGPQTRPDAATPS
jgi:ribokinase